MSGNVGFKRRQQCPYNRLCYGRRTKKPAAYWIWACLGEGVNENLVLYLQKEKLEECEGPQRRMGVHKVDGGRNVTLQDIILYALVFESREFTVD